VNPSIAPTTRDTVAPMMQCSSCGNNFSPSKPDQQICDECLAALSHPTASESRPLIGSYSLAHELGAGRFSTSWLAEAPNGGGVILKLLRAYAPDGETTKRFLDEAKRLGQSALLDHAGLARVLDAGVHAGGSLFLVYESGGEITLADELRGRGRLVTGRSLELCAQLCEALHALHKNGFSHFDVKPANVGVTKDDDGVEQAVLLDGATGHLLMHAGLRETGMMPISTAAYLSPELASGRPADERSDLYSVGVLLYQLVSGRLPFTGHTSESLIESHKSQRPLRLRDVGRRVHGDLEALIQRILSKDPHARFASGNEMAAALRKVAPIADQASDDPGEDDIEDPLQVKFTEPPEPEVAPPPKPRLEIPGQVHPVAMRTELPMPAVPVRPLTPPPARASAVAERAAQSAKAKPSFTPLRGALIAFAVIAVAAVAWSMRPRADPPPHAKKKRAPAPIAAADAAAPSDVEAPAQPVAPTEAAPRAAAPMPPAKLSPANAPPAPVQTAKAAAPKKSASIASSSNGNRLMFSDAEKLIAKKRAKPAMRTLFFLLDRPDLNGPERAKATRLMAEAESIAGNKDAAIDWYRKYLRVTDDATERARVIRQIQNLNR
jgi:serine/threonine protein kinase